MKSAILEMSININFSLQIDLFNNQELYKQVEEISCEHRDIFQMRVHLLKIEELNLKEFEQKAIYECVWMFESIGIEVRPEEILRSTHLNGKTLFLDFSVRKEGSETIEI